MVHAAPSPIISAAALLLFAGCAQPGSPAAQATRSAGPGRQAAVCSVAGRVSGVLIPRTTPAMTVSNDGSCDVAFDVVNAIGTTITVVNQPRHGQLETGGNDVHPYLRYRPAPGYEGPDSFTVVTGVTRATTAEFTVAVVKP